MTTLPTREELLALDEKTWTSYVKVYVEASISRIGARLAELVKSEFVAACNEDDEALREFGDTVPVKAEFASFEHDNGWFYHEGDVTIVFADGRWMNDFDLSHVEQANEYLADLSGHDAVGAASLMTLDLRDGSVEFNSHGNR